MGLQYGFENIRNVRSGKGVFSGCEVTKSAANTLQMSAGRCKFGLTAADITAKSGQHINEGGAEQSIAAPISLNTAPLANGTYVLYLKTNSTLDTVAEADTSLDNGPLVTLNNVGTTGVNSRKLDTPSIRLCTFKKVAGDVDATSISYDSRDTAL